MKLPKLTAVIEPGDDGWYIANCPELGIVSQGETPEHAEAMIKEAVELWLECADEDEIRRRLEERKVAIKELAVTQSPAEEGAREIVAVSMTDAFHDSLS